MVETCSLTVIDPLERHARHVGAQDLLRQRIAMRDHRKVVLNVQQRQPVWLHPIHDILKIDDSYAIIQRFGEICRMPVVVGVLKETAESETRVALVPEIAGKLKSLGARVLVERGAGALSYFADEAYADAELGDADAILARRRRAFVRSAARHRRGERPEGAAPSWSDSCSPTRATTWCAPCKSAASPALRWSWCRASRARNRWMRCPPRRRSPATRRRSSPPIP